MEGETRERTDDDRLENRRGLEESCPFVHACHPTRFAKIIHNQKEGEWRKEIFGEVRTKGEGGRDEGAGQRLVKPRSARSDCERCPPPKIARSKLKPYVQNRRGLRAGAAEGGSEKLRRSADDERE